MTIKRTWLLFLPLFSLLFSGCAPMIIGGGGAVATGMVGERRGAGNYVEDNWIAWKIRSNYIRSSIVKIGNINVAVYQGRVLLTGAAASEEEIKEATRLAQLVRGVEKVDSELRVQSETLEEIAHDSWISTQVKAKLFSDSEVRGLDIHVETTKKIVYLTGQAQSLAERNRAIDLAKEVKWVEEVVSYILVNGESIPLSRTTSK
ncbi:MAG: BON domain-containing protein [Magnetococcales bacterium]|nr:BON domain-containing protein [Magnetococcales bacterium]